MKVDSSNVVMIGESSKVQRYTSSQTTMFADNVTQQQKNAAIEATEASEKSEDEEAAVNASVSKEGRKSLTVMNQPPVQQVQNRFSLNEFMDFRIQLLEKMMENLTGKRFKFRNIYEEMYGNWQQDQMTSGFQWLNAQPGQRLTDSGKVLVQTKNEFYEKEKMSFSMKAHVNTSDGKTIDVELNLNMSREFYASNSSTIEVARKKDPLVINYGASSASLSSTKFEFDIDCDGKPDQISQLMTGSGFLAVDWNKDGKINNGGELFGARTGDGFKELAQHDTDKNGWIDENDEIFNSLRIWLKDENGKDILLGLGEVGIGAIYLGSVATAFDIKEGASMNGVLQRTGFFLKEDGTAGTVQHVDLVV